MPIPPKSLKRIILLILGAVGLIGIMAAGYLVVQEEYTIYDGEETETVRGTYETVADVLDAAGVQIRAEDTVRPPLSAAADPQRAIQVERAVPVTLRTEEGTDDYWTHQRTVGAFLAEVGVKPQRTDEIYAGGDRVAFSALDNTALPATIEIGAFKTITIHDGGNQRTLRTAVQTVGAALQEAGIALYAADGVDPEAGAWLQPGLNIRVRRSMALTIRVDGRVIQTRSHHSNPVDVLAELGIGLVGMDYTRPGPETTLQAGDTIEVVRVTEDFRTEDEPIPYDSRFQPTEELDIDNRAVLQSGVPGILRRRIRVRYENGAAVSETPDGEWIARQPQDEIIGYGTNIVVQVLETPEGYFEYWRKVRMRVTSYT
ncbi:MAG TPA: ubiquitin-like domain-containing protein, partial [Candidatus Sulfomarinibacteraceae bacterium]|nr:ubiquitin-like domain-containing protein [Candidatus Sulfomarinibacteraceae bacterium]